MISRKINGALWCAVDHLRQLFEGEEERDTGREFCQQLLSESGSTTTQEKYAMWQSFYTQYFSINTINYPLLSEQQNLKVMCCCRNLYFWTIPSPQKNLQKTQIAQSIPKLRCRGEETVPKLAASFLCHCQGCRPRMWASPPANFTGIIVTVKKCPPDPTLKFREQVAAPASFPRVVWLHFL